MDPSEAKARIMELSERIKKSVNKRLCECWAFREIKIFSISFYLVIASLSSLNNFQKSHSRLSLVVNCTFCQKQGLPKSNHTAINPWNAWPVLYVPKCRSHDSGRIQGFGGSIRKVSSSLLRHRALFKWGIPTKTTVSFFNRRQLFSWVCSQSTCKYSDIVMLSFSCI